MPRDRNGKLPLVTGSRKPAAPMPARLQRRDEVQELAGQILMNKKNFHALPQGTPVPSQTP